MRAGLGIWTSCLAALALGAAGATACKAGDSAAGDPGAEVAADAPPDLAAEVTPELPADPSPDLPDAPLGDLSTDTAPDAPSPVIPQSLGGSRPAALFVPEDYDPATAWPLVVVLHGYTLSGFWEMVYLGLSDRITSKGFVLVAPDGTVDLQGNQFWNASPSCCNFNGSDVDDVAYLRSLVVEAKQVLNIDPGRIVLFGHSNGGFMSLRMACDASDLITGIATVGASMNAETACTPASPVSILLIHGTKDETIAYAGGTFGGLAPFVGVDALMEGWRQRDQCPVGPVAGTAPMDFDVAVDGAETTSIGWSGCLDGTRVDHWRMDGTSHNPAFTEAFKDAVVDHLLPQAPVSLTDPAASRASPRRTGRPRRPGPPRCRGRGRRRRRPCRC